MNTGDFFPEVEERVKQDTKIQLVSKLKVCELAGKHVHLKHSRIT
jgi:hypothetical protein